MMDILVAFGLAVAMTVPLFVLFVATVIGLLVLRSKLSRRVCNNWVSVSKALPNNGDIVIAKYEGVYEARYVRFWLDGGGHPHFGGVHEDDGAGSQPATHWKPLSV